MATASRTMVISLQKAGTHLMQGLMGELGYKMAGVPRPSPDNVAQFDDEQRKKIAAITLSKKDYDAFLELEGTDEFNERAQEAWAALGWSWQRRLGQRVVTRYGQTRYDFTDEFITNREIAYSKFADTPAGLCWIYHELDVNKVDGTFLSEWAETGNPRLIFNYRDPRDTLVSMINFLEGRTRAGYGNFYEFDIFSSILASKPTWEDKIDYAIRDESFLGWDQFEKGLWLLHHPDVCKVRYEDLVGADGGGSRERQQSAVARLIDHISSDNDAEKIAGRVYNPESWSFFRGKCGTWREKFTDRNIAVFNERFGDVLSQYGYE